MIAHVNATRVAAFLMLSLTAALSCGAARAASFSPVSPCDVKSFELKIDIEPVNSVEYDAEPIGVRFHYEREPGRGLASRVHTDESRTVSRSSCALWQKKYWPLISPILSENKRSERSEMVCRNIAFIEYKVNGGAAKKAKLCVGDAHDDGLSFGFKRLYEGTDDLVGR